jgi:hypothetical protein
MNESYFGGTRKEQRGQGARGKSIVFGPLKRVGRVYTKAVVGLGADPFEPYRAPYPQGLGLLYRCLSRLSLFAALWYAFGG